MIYLLILFEIFTLVRSEAFSSEKELRESKLEMLDMRKELQTLREECQTNQDLHRTLRLLLPMTTVNNSKEIVAFYAYMSHTEVNPSLHHQFKFDVVKTNVGGGYNPYSGVFTAPSPGVYVFTWTIYTGDHGAIKFEILVNGVMYANGYGETNDVAGDFDSDSGTIVASLNQGDSVYMQSSLATTGTLLARSDVKTSFAGWKL